MTQREVINNVLTDFLGDEVLDNDEREDSFLGLTLDEDEIEILTNALTEALESNNECKT